MPKDQAISVRTVRPVYVYLDGHADAYTLPISVAQAVVVGEFERQRPLGFQIKRIIADSGVSFALCWTPTGKQIEAFDSLDAAKAGLKAFREARGFDSRRFKLAEEIAEEDLRDPPLTLSEFTSGNAA
jgi:hypothetical protein